MTTESTETNEQKAGTQTEPPKTDPPKTVTITQDELDKLIGKVRTDTRDQSTKELAKLKADYEEKLKLSSMKEEERAKAERELEYKKLNDELAAARREIAVRSAEAELAKLDLNVELATIVLGKDADETAKNIANLKKQVDAMVKKQLDSTIKTGAPRGSASGPGTQASSKETIAKRMKESGQWSESDVKKYLGS